MLQAWLEDLGAAVTLSGCDSAIVAVGVRCGQPPLVCYSRPKLVAHFVAEGMSVEEAEEWIDVNIEGAWVGETTPIVLHFPEEEAQCPESSSC